MSLIANCAAYMALVYEVFSACLIMVQMVRLSKIMQFDMLDVLVLLSHMCKLLCFGVLAVGVVGRHRLMIKIWILWSYVQIDWGSVGKMFINIYEFLFTKKFTTKKEFLQLLVDNYGPLIAQILTRVGIILMVYRFYKSLEPPKSKSKTQLVQVAAALKVK